MRTLLLLLCAAPSLLGGTYYVTVAGLGGEPDYEQRFQLWSNDAGKAFGASAGSQVITLNGAGATKAAVKAALEKVAHEAKPADALVITLIGHGSFDGTDYKINLPGPDLSAAELAALLNQIPAGRQLVVNMTSSSGACAEALKHANRVIVTATRNGQEKNATTFARYWVEALRDPAADSDKNESLTALEAYNYAKRRTEEFFTENKRIATEHAALDDSSRAAQFVLLRTGAAAAAAANPAKRDLLAKKDALESQIDQLKYQKATLPEAQYKQQLTQLLLELARVQAEIEK